MWEIMPCWNLRQSLIYGAWTGRRNPVRFRISAEPTGMSRKRSIGCTGNFMATPATVAEKKKKEPSRAGASVALPEQRKEKYELEGAVILILSNMPAEDYGSAVRWQRVEEYMNDEE